MSTHSSATPQQEQTGNNESIQTHESVDYSKMKKGICVDMATQQRARQLWFALAIKVNQTFLGSEGTVSPLWCHSACASLSRYQLASRENIFPAMAGARQRGGWLSSGAATCWLLAPIWRGRNRDLTALPQKSGPSHAWKGDFLPPPPHVHTLPGHKVKKSSRPECTCAATSCQRGSARRVGKGVGWHGGGART